MIQMRGGLQEDNRCKWKRKGVRGGINDPRMVCGGFNTQQDESGIGRKMVPTSYEGFRLSVNIFEFLRIIQEEIIPEQRTSAASQAMLNLTSQLDG